MEQKSVSKSALNRLPVYLEYLKKVRAEREYISATLIASSLGTGDVQVRKDLATVSGGGKPKIGYNISELIKDLESFLGFDSINTAVLIGAGKLGRALLDYDGFHNYGLEIVAAFDINPDLAGNQKNGKAIYNINDINAFCQKHKPKIGIITVPSEAAQEACDKLVSCGIEAIMNLSSSHLAVPKNVILKNENLATSLALLARHLK